MSRLAAALGAAWDALTGAGCRSALVGGLAVSVRSEPRFTRVVDLVVAVANDAEAESLVRQMLERAYGVVAVVEQESAKRLATVRLHSPVEGAVGVVVDLLFASSGIEPEVVALAEELEVFAGLRVPVAVTGHLLALSVAPNRPQDAADIAALLREASESDIATARTAVRLMAQRGFDRGRPVVEDLENLLRRRS